MSEIIYSFADVWDRYDAAFVDLWGCVHDGYRAFDEAVAALQAFRARGGRAILVTNAPRQHRAVAQQIDRIGVPGDAWDAIATSGDSARFAMWSGAVGNKVHWIGQPHDEIFFEPMALVTEAVHIERVPLAEAEGLVVTGPPDPFADPDVWRGPFLDAKSRGLKLLCANPDIVVDRGEKREWCAGALADLYARMGGTSLYFGKPWPPIYDLARQRLAALGGAVDDRKIICIGDGILTDVKGAVGEDLDVIFISGGLAAEETLTDIHPDPDALAGYLAEQGFDPIYTIGKLR